MSVGPEEMFDLVKLSDIELNIFFVVSPICCRVRLTQKNSCRK